MSYSRADKKGAHRANYERNKKRIMSTQNTCGICGHPVDFSLKPPHPMSPTVDHIIPVAKGGHPSDIDNLQLAHWTCNRQKSDKIFRSNQETKQAIGNRVLPQSIDWMNYRENQTEQKETKKTVIKIRRKVKQ